jgi:hypothetical protein
MEIFNFYHEVYHQDISHRHEWRRKHLWFNLSHICKRWRAIVLASCTRLDVCLLLKQNNEAHFRILTSANPVIRIAIEYKMSYKGLTSNDMSRLLSTLKHPDRICGIDLTLEPKHLNKFFKAKATKCPFPALESLALCDGKIGDALDIPATFLKGTNLHLRLRSLKLHPISLTSPGTFRLLSLARGLTDLSLKIKSQYRTPDLSCLLSQLQGMPYLCHLDLEIICYPEYLRQLTEPKERFSLSKLTSFCYRGHSTLLNILMMGFEAPSIQNVDINLNDLTRTPHLIPHLLQFIDGIGKHYHAVHVVLGQRYSDFSFLAPSEGVGHHSLRFRMHSQIPSDQSWLMEMITMMFSEKVSTAEELVITKDMPVGEEVSSLSLRTFLEHLPSVKEFRLQGIDNRIANALQPHHEETNLSVLPALERITFSTSSYADISSELALLQPFVAARQQAGRQVKVLCGSLDRRW